MPDTGPILATDVAGLSLRNPVILAAGTCGYLDEMAGALDLARVGAIVTKSITRLPREGNETWRILDARAGMLNAIGLANVGLDRFAAHIAPRAATAPTVVIGSVAGFSVEDYVAVAAAMDDAEHLRAVEINVSCPNVRGATEFGADPASLRELVRAVRPVVASKPLIVKLSPIAIGNPDIVDIARAAIDPGGQPAGPNSRPGADAITIGNTIPAMAIDVRTRRPRLANVTGGLSGPALHPVAVRLVHLVHRGIARDSKTPLIGAGGVMRWEDAAEFILAGASGVQMGTALFADPKSPLVVVKGLARWVRRQGRESVAELVGALETG